MTKDKIFIVGFVLAALSADLYAQSKDSDLTRKWQVFSEPSLGVGFKYPGHLKVWTKGQEIFLDKAASVQKKSRNYSQLQGVDRALNGRIHSNDGLYLIQLSVGRGDFNSANKKIGAFDLVDKEVRLTYGRFQNPAAKKIQSKQWMGYETTIICSTDDEYGFHAAGGLCYWSLISDGLKYVVIDTQNIATAKDEKMVHSIVKSIVFSK